MTVLFMPLFVPLLSSPCQGLGLPWLSPPCPQTCPWSASFHQSFFQLPPLQPLCATEYQADFIGGCPQISSDWRTSFRVQSPPALSCCPFLFMGKLWFSGLHCLQPLPHQLHLPLPLLHDSAPSSHTASIPHRFANTPQISIKARFFSSTGVQVPCPVSFGLTHLLGLPAATPVFLWHISSDLNLLLDTGQLSQGVLLRAL